MSRHCLGCEHLRAFCAKCGEIGNLTENTVCKMQIGDADLPSLGELEKHYREFVAATKSCRPNAMASNLHALHRLMSVMGWTADQSVAIITESALEEFIARANDYSPSTIKGTIECVANLTNRKAMKWYADHGIVVKKLPSIAFKAKPEQWKSLTTEERRKLRTLQFKYSLRYDPRLWLMMTFACEHGMRKSDILRLRWSENFVQEDGRWFLDYVSNKTGKPVHWPIDEDTWLRLTEARKQMEQLKVRRLHKDFDSVLRVREYGDNEEATSAIWNQLCRDLRKVMGWQGAKAGHNLRKDSTDTIYQAYGIDYAVAFSGDTEQILRKHYIGKKRIDINVRSIAKL